MMSSRKQIPPWLQEQILKLQQSQQNLQSIMTQKQNLEMEQIESDKALDEIKNAKDDEIVYKYAGSILIKSNKKDLLAELAEKKELANTRSIVLSKQETRLKQNIKEQEEKINELIKK